uniref:uncharacterized protein LOC124056047 n=1 Tax=Scatophagus argus TaxID=75038 RepID=UPI001ED7F131|nr:uncharacterized protein LOC124056047 [Scatophagus argus]
MMKTLCVVVVLSLFSVCQSASLACEKLLNPLDKGPDLSGSWHIIAVSSENCLFTALINALVLLSAKVNITSKDTPNTYDTNFKIKIYGYCVSESEPLFYVNNTLFGLDSNNAPTGDPDVLLQTGCPDCMVLKGVDVISTFLLLSKRKTVSAAELKEFETQTECLGWSKPLVLNSDHDYENCQSLDDDNTDIDTSGLIYQRLKRTSAESFKCLAENFLSYPRAAFQWAQQFWSKR